MRDSLQGINRNIFFHLTAWMYCSKLFLAQSLILSWFFSLPCNYFSVLKRGQNFEQSRVQWSQFLNSNIFSVWIVSLFFEGEYIFPDAVVTRCSARCGANDLISKICPAWLIKSKHPVRTRSQTSWLCKNGPTIDHLCNGGCSLFALFCLELCLAHIEWNKY